MFTALKTLILKYYSENFLPNRPVSGRSAVTVAVVCFFKSVNIFWTII